MSWKCLFSLESGWQLNRACILTSMGLVHCDVWISQATQAIISISLNKNVFRLFHEVYHIIGNKLCCKIMGIDKFKLLLKTWFAKGYLGPLNNELLLSSATAKLKINLNITPLKVFWDGVRWLQILYSTRRVMLWLWLIFIFN